MYHQASANVQMSWQQAHAVGEQPGTPTGSRGARSLTSLGLLTLERSRVPMSRKISSHRLVVSSSLQREVQICEADEDVEMNSPAPGSIPARTDGVSAPEPSARPACVSAVFNIKAL